MGFEVVRETFEEGGFERGGERGAVEEGNGSGNGLAPGRRLQLAELQAEVARRQAAWRREAQEARCPSGWKQADALLQGGFPRGQVSVVSGPAGSGRTTLTAGAVARLTSKGKLCAWLDPQGTLNPGALDTFGVQLERLLWVRSASASSITSNSPTSSSSNSRERSVAGRSGSVWAAHLLARSGAFALVVVELYGERLSMGAGARLAEAARAGNTAVVVLAEGRDADVPQAALRIRLEPSVESGIRLVTRQEAGGAGSAAAATPRARRRVQLVVERTRRGAPGAGPVSFLPPFRPPPPWTTHDPLRSASARRGNSRLRSARNTLPATPGGQLPTVGGALEVVPFTDKLHSGRSARYRPPTEETERVS